MVGGMIFAINKKFRNAVYHSKETDMAFMAFKGIEAGYLLYFLSVCYLIDGR
jgi:hypothetical protein